MPRNSRDPIFDKGTIYHSAMVKAGPFVATVTSEEHESKFSKPSDQKFVVGLKVDGNDHFYQTENEDCGKAFKGWKGQTVTIEAKGHKEDAEIIITDDAGEERQSPRGGGEERGGRGGREEPRGGRSQERSSSSDRGANRQERQQEAEPEDRATVEAKALKKARAMAARCSVLGVIAFKAAEHTMIEHFGPDAFSKDVRTEDIRAVAAVMFIELSRGTDISKLPLSMPEPDAHKQREREPEQRQERQPERREDPPADEPEDDIPF